MIHFLAQIGTPFGCELYIDPDARLHLGVGFSHGRFADGSKHQGEVFYIKSDLNAGQM